MRPHLKRGRRRSNNIYKRRNSTSGQKRKSSCVSYTDEAERFSGKALPSNIILLISYSKKGDLESDPGLPLQPHQSPPNYERRNDFSLKKWKLIQFILQVKETGLWGQLGRVRRQLKSRNSQQTELLIHTEHCNEENHEENIITRFKNIFTKNM